MQRPLTLPRSRIAPGQSEATHVGHGSGLGPLRLDPPLGLELCLTFRLLQGSGACCQSEGVVPVT